jgi:hypothetical protein
LALLRDGAGLRSSTSSLSTSGLVVSGGGIGVGTLCLIVVLFRAVCFVAERCLRPGLEDEGALLLVLVLLRAAGNGRCRRYPSVGRGLMERVSVSVVVIRVVVEVICRAGTSGAGGTCTGSRGR